MSTCSIQRPIHYDGLLIEKEFDLKESPTSRAGQLTALYGIEEHQKLYQ